MAKIDFYQIEDDEKKVIFEKIAGEKGMKPFAVEKDWWVSRTLEIIFQMKFSNHLIFKGGTSLSKAFKLIHRFSEDIDLAIDRNYFFETEKIWSKNKRSQLRKKAGEFTAGIFLDELKKAYKKRGYEYLSCDIIHEKESDHDPRVIEVHYKNIIPTYSEYILPRLLIEVGCRSLREPYSVKKFGSLVDEVFVDKEFADPLFEIPTVEPERTFLEKIFLLHEEFSRPDEKMRVDRLSRHLYDIYHLTNSGIGDKAISDKDLYETIVSHRHKFSRIGKVDYNHHNPKLINPIPPDVVMQSWRDDYAKMQEDMIYEDPKPTFDDLLSNLYVLTKKLKNLPWDFELKFAKL